MPSMKTLSDEGFFRLWREYAPKREDKIPDHRVRPLMEHVLALWCHQESLPTSVNDNPDLGAT